MSGSFNLSSLFTDPTTQALMGAAGAAGQLAMPTRMPIPFGAVLGQAAAGFGQGAQNAYATQLAQQKAGLGQLQLEQMQALQPYVIAQQKAINDRMLGLTGAGGGQATAANAPGFAPTGNVGADGSAPLIDPQLAVMMALRESMNPNGNGRGAAPWLDYLRSITPSGGGYYVGQDAQVHATPGANPAISGRTLATEGPKAALDVQKAWEMLAPEAKKALQNANIDVTKAWQMPGSYTPGSTVATPAQLQGGPPPPDPFPAWASQIIRNENPSGNPSEQNPNSTATGNGQFIQATWPNVLRATRPDLTAGKSDAQLLQLRSNPDLALSATEQYARQNGQALAQAGMPVNAATIYMAHALGPQGAISLLQKPANTPVAAFLPDAVIKANPYLQNGATVGGVVQHFSNVMTRQPEAVGNLGLVRNPDGTVGTPGGGFQSAQQSAQSSQNSGPATVPASPSVTEAQKEGDRLSDLRKDVLTQAKESANAHLRIQQVQNAIAEATKNGIPTGYFSPELAEAAAAAKSLGIDTKTLGIDPKAVSNVQAANEAMVQITGEMLKRLFPQRITNMDIKLYGENLAHYGMDPGALNQVLALADGAAKYDMAKADSMLGYESHPPPGVSKGSLVGWEPQFYKQAGYGPQFWDMMQASQKPGEQNAVPNAPSTASAGLPPAALKALQPGHITTFKNGQAWTLGANGEPTRVR